MSTKINVEGRRLVKNDKIAQIGQGGGGGAEVVALPYEGTQESGSITLDDWNKLLKKDTVLFTYDGNEEKVYDTYIYYRTTANSNKWVDYLSNAITDSQGNIIQKKIRFKGPDYSSNALTYAISPISIATIPAEVSGLDDGTNWTSLTIGEDTYGIPEIPAAPTTDGTYVLKVTVASGEPTFEWVAE